MGFDIIEINLVIFIYYDCLKKIIILHANIEVKYLLSICSKKGWNIHGEPVSCIKFPTQQKMYAKFSFACRKFLSKDETSSQEIFCQGKKFHIKGSNILSE